MREGWTYTPLSAVLRLDIEKVRIEPDKQYPIVGVLGFGRGLLYREPLTIEKTKYRELNLVKPNQLVFSKLKAFEGAATVTPPTLELSFASQEFPTFSTSSNLSPAYLRLLTELPEFWTLLGAKSKGMGGRRERLNPQDFLTLYCKFPPLSEQLRIVDLLAAVDSAIGASQAEIDAATVLRNQALNHSLNNPREDWNKVPLNSLIEHQIGGAWGKPPGESEVNVVSFGTKAYGTRTALDPSSGTERSVTKLQYERRQLLTGDIVIEVSGGSEAQAVGRTLFVENDLPGVIPSSFFRLLRFNRSETNPRFMLFLLQNMYFTGVTKDWQSNTTSIRNLNVKGFLALQVNLPPLQDQQRIVDTVSLLDTSISTAESGVDRLQQLRLSLQSVLLAGEHEIPQSYDQFLTETSDT